MKLHLPVGLRAALLAILLCSPMAMGNVKVYQGVKEDGTGGTEVVPVDGKIDIMDDYWSLLGDVVITVDGETTGGDGLTALTYHGNMENCRTTITVESGGTFTCQGGSMIGTATAYASLPIESETIFNVSGGTVDLGGVGVGVVSDDAANARSSVIFNISENGQVLSSSSSIGGINGGSSNHSEVTMNLTSGGKLKIGSTTSGGEFGLVKNTDSSSVVTISVDGENSSVELGAPSIGNVSAANSKSVVDIDVTQHGSFKLLSNAKSSLDSNPSGSIGTVSSADSHSDVYITVAGEGSLFEIASYWQTIGTVSTSKGGVQHLGSSTTKIEVREGGVFTHKMGDVGLNKSTAATPKGGSAATTELMLTVDGGTYNMGFCDDRQGSHLGGVGTPATDIHGKNTTEIHVQNKGQFNFQAKRGYIGASYNDGSDVTLNIFLDKGGVFSFEKYEDDDTKSQVETHIGYACGGNVNLTLDVGTDSKFSVLPQSKAQQIDQSIGAAQAYLNTTSEVSAKVDIYLHDGGTMDFRPTTITSFSRVHFAGIGISYGKSDKKVSAATSITVGNKEQQTEAEGMSEGAASTFNFGGGDIGLAWVSGDGKVENTAAITVNEGGTFTMTGGRLGYVNVSSNGKGTVRQDLSLTLNGGDMMITGGSILASEGGRTAGTSERTGSIELSGDSVLTIGEGVTIGSDVRFAVTMHGGKLAGEGISKLTEKVSTVTIDTGDQFKGEIGLGGIGAEKITSIKINSGDIAIVDIGEGTLTLGAEDILTVGENSAWDGKDVSTAPDGKQALLQFKTEESDSPSEGCIVDVHGKVTLNFDGQYLAEQKGEDGTVTLRVWITNGKLKGEEETAADWAKDHFTIGTGWGLAVTSYDAENGMLVLGGKSTVWVATVDGDDGNRHAAADASALEEYTKVIVDEGTTFTADGDATIKQLEGQNGSKLDLVKGVGIESATITLENVDNKEGSPGTGDTVFEGSITVGEGVNLGKTGNAIFTVQGNLQAGGNVDVAAGELVLEGADNTVAGALSMEAEGKLQVKQALTLSGTSHLTAGTITGTGTLTVARGGELSLEAGSGWSLGVSNIHVAGTLSQEKGPITAENIVVQADGNYNLMDGAISALGGADDEPGTLDLQVSGTFTMSGGNVAKGGKADITIGKEGEMIVDSYGAIGTAGDTGDSETTITVNGGSFVLGSGTNQSSIGNAGSFESPHTSSVDITVTDGGSFAMGGNGQIGVISGDGDEGTTTINVNGGTFDVNVSGNGIGTVLSAGQEGFRSESHVTITVSGDGAFTLSKANPDGLSGGMIGYAQLSSGGKGEAFVETKLTVENTGSFTMFSGNLGGRETDSDLLTSELTIELLDQGQMQISGGKVGEGATLNLSDEATMTQTGGEITGGTFTLNDNATLTQSNGTINGGSITLSNSATLTQSDVGTINGSSITLSGGAIMAQTGGMITGGTFKLSDHARLTQSKAGKIEGSSFTLSGSAIMEQTGGKIAKGTFTLSDGAKLTQSNGTIDGGSITLSGSATLTQTGGEITGGTLELGSGASLTQSDAGTISGSSITLSGGAQVSQKGEAVIKGGTITLSGEGTSFAQEGGRIGEGAKFSLSDGATLTQTGGEITGGTLELGSGASLTQSDAGTISGSSITLSGGAQVSQKGEAVIKGGTITLSGEGTSFAQEGGSIGEGAKFSLSDGATLTQTGGQITGGTLELSDGASLTQSDAGTISGSSITLSGGAQVSQKGEAVIKGGTITLSGEGTGFAQEGGSIGEGAKFSLSDGATLTQTGGQITGGTLELSDGASLTQSDAGTISGSSITLRGGAQVSQKGEAVIKSGTITLSGEGTSFAQEGGSIGEGAKFSLSNRATMKQTGGQITGGTLELSDGASLTQSDAGTISGSSITLSGGAQVSQKGEAVIKGGTITLSGEGTGFAQEGGSVGEGAKFSLSDSATMKQTGGQITGGTLELSGGASLTQSDAGTISGSSITLSGSASMRQDGGQITGGTLELSGGATMTQSNGTINGTSVTLSGEGTGFAQEGGSISEGAKFSLNDGAKLTLSGGSMNAAVTMEGKTSRYDLGNQAAKGSITMQGGNLANAENYAGTLAIQTDDTYTGALDLGGVDAARITKVQIEASETELHNLKSGSTLTFEGEDNKMVVGVQHVYSEGQTEPEGESMVQFQEGKGQIAFGEAGKLQLHLENEVLMHMENDEPNGIEGQLEILFTNGSFSGMPEGGQKELEAWLEEHFVLETGLEDIKVLLLSDAEGGHLILTGSTKGIWIASRNGQNVDVADLLNNYSAVIVDKDLTLTLPTTQEETPTTIVHQLRSDEKTHGDFIVKTESGATAGHTVQLHNENTDGDNGGTDFYGSVHVEGTGLEAATLEKTGDAALNVHGNLESSGTVEVKEGTLALGGTANSIGTLAMSGGELQVDGTLALTGVTEMSEENSGSISGEGNVKLGSGASLTLAGGVSYEVQNTQLENGARMSQKGEAALNGGSITLGGEGTGYTQASGTISGATFTLTEGASFAQAGGNIGGGAAFSLSDGANLTQSKGAIDGASITLSGSASMRQDGGQITGGTLDLSGGATMTQSNGTINGTSVTLSGEGTGYTQEGGSIGKGAEFSLSDGATLTLSGGSMNGAVTMEGKTSLYDLGNQAAQGDITMHGGCLANAGNYGGNLAIQTSDTYTGALDLGGVDAARITSIQLAGKDTYLTGLKEGSTLTLHTGDSFKVTEQNVWVDGKGGPEGKQAFFQFGTAGAGEVGTGSVVDVASGAIITLNFVGQQIAEAVGEDGGITLKVWITNGQLGGGKTEDAAGTWAGEHFEIGTGWGLNVESYDADQGLLVLKGQSNIWDAKVNGDQVAGHAEANASELDLAEKVIIDENTVVAVDQDATIHQLDGEGEYSLELENKGEGDKTITLRNHGSSSSAMGSTGDTVFGGDILAGDGVNLRKTGDAALKVQGSLKAEGNVAVEEGKLVLGENGEHSIGGELSLGEHGTLQVDGSLTLSGNMSRESAGTLTGQGTVILDGENVTFGDVTLGEELTFQMGDNSSSVDFGERDVTLSNLKGNSVKGREMILTGGEGGIYSGTVDGRLVVENNVELLGRDNEACDLVIQGTTGQATLAADSKYNSLDNGGAGGTGSTLKIASGDSSAGAQITVNGDIVFRKGAETDFTINLSDPGLWTANEEEHDATMLSTGETIHIEKGTKFVIDCSQKGISDAKGDLTHVVILRGGLIQEVEKYNAPEKNSGANRQAIYAASARAAYAMQTRAAEEQPGERQVRGAQVEGGVLFNQLYETPTMWTNGTESWINAKHRTMSPLANLATTSNSMGGLRLLWQDLNDKGLTQATQQVSEILALLDNLAATNPAAARQMMAAVAGSTLTSLSSAQNAALRNQMSRVRDHALQAARLRGDGHWGNGQENVVTDPKGVTVRTAQQTLSSGSTTHAWIEGTSFFSEQHSVGDESGYRLNSWGGAVGVDKQLADNWSVGAYLSASYGDLEARAAEYAKGDMDTYAVGVWGQNHTGRWGNTLLALWAWNDASLRRMVNHGAGYAGRSDADGYSIGAQWELTYDLYMNEEKTNVLQPLFGVAVMRTEMDGFSEKGAGSLGLNVKDQTRDTVTLALGARWLAAISSGKAINRAVNTELHANVAQDLGDRRSDADVALQANPTYIRNVRGAKAGSTAFQFGAGVNVPMTPNSQIYVNAGGELREHASSWNAALGVRMGF